MDMAISEEPIVIEGDDAALILQRVNQMKDYTHHVYVICYFTGTKRNAEGYWSDVCGADAYRWNRG